VIGVAPGGPWTKAQVRLVAGCDAVAAVAIAFAAVASGGGSEQDQIVWLDLAVLGLVLVVVVTGSLLLVARRAVGRRRLRLVPDVLERVATAPTADGAWWWLPGTARAHRGGCQMIAGKPAEVISTDAIRASRLSRCEVCG